MTALITQTASEIVGLGVTDPDLFVAMALFEDNFGPDFIGDMATNVILGNLLNFNARIFRQLSIPLKEYKLITGNGTTHTAMLPENPYRRQREQRRQHRYRSQHLHPVERHHPRHRGCLVHLRQF